DIHVHAREDISGKHTYKEDFSSAGKAALNGGVVQIADMPNNPVPPVDDESYLQKEKLTHKSPIHITLYAGVGPNTYPLKRNVPYKVFMGPSIGELYFRNNQELETVIQRYRNQNVSFHCEDPEVLENSKNKPTHEERRPVEAELLATDFALYLIEKYKLKGKLCHYSSGVGLQKIKEAKRKGLNVTCEVTPTHLFFDKTMLTDENRKWFQMNPPLRNPEDKKFLLQALKDGEIDYLATDHAPHSIEEKLNGISGISQLDTYGLFVTHLIVNENVSLKRIAEVTSKNPADFVKPYLPSKFGKGFGYIREGYSACFTILNLKKKTLFLKSMIQSKSGWSPFENYTFPGSIEAVYYLGQKIRKLHE
ncbi:MAG: amidohydrolase family protein, partial [Leptospiraceae bacterium]|nr:amidohydrolase family protein [Leptospiraceae bacterium]